MKAYLEDSNNTCMKKDHHDLLYSIWIDSRTAMIIRDEPHGTHHFEVIHNEYDAQDRFEGETDDKTGLFGATISRQLHDQNRGHEHIKKFIKEVAHKVRYAHTVHIMGSGETRFALQNEIESQKDLANIIITNSACKKLTRQEFEMEAEKLFSTEDV
jgi:hypothetical protein